MKKLIILSSFFVNFYLYTMEELDKCDLFTLQKILHYETLYQLSQYPRDDSLIRDIQQRIVKLENEHIQQYQEMQKELTSNI